MRTPSGTLFRASWLAVLMASAAVVANAQAPKPPLGTDAITGTWLARNFRTTMGQLVTVVLELSAQGDSISGLLRVESPTGAAAPSVPVWGVVRADSVFLADSRHVPLIAARVAERRLIGRMAGTQGRLNRGVPSLTTLAESRPVTFARQ